MQYYNYLFIPPNYLEKKLYFVKKYLSEQFKSYFME